MTGWTTKINQERYKDSVRATQTFLQQQYNLVYNVENGRTSDMSCQDAIGDSDTVSTGESKPRGKADCVLLGRFIAIESTASRVTIRVSAVVGTVDPVTTIGDPESIFLRYEPKTVKQDIGLSEASLDVPWNPTISSINGNDEQKQISIAILRSPATGAISTYINAGKINDVFGTEADSNGSILLADGQPGGDTSICLDPEAVFAGQRMGIVIKKNAAAQSAIETVAGC